MRHEEHALLATTASQVLADLREARGMLDSIRQPQVRERLDLLLARAELGVSDLRRHLAGPPRPHRPPVAAAEDSEIALKAIKARWPDKERLALIYEMGTGGRFTSTQVRALLEAFDFNDLRSEAAVQLHSKVVDRENFFQALDALSFPSNAMRPRRG